MRRQPTHVRAAWAGIVALDVAVLVATLFLTGSVVLVIFEILVLCAGFLILRTSRRLR